MWKARTTAWDLTSLIYLMTWEIYEMYSLSSFSLCKRLPFRVGSGRFRLKKPSHQSKRMSRTSSRIPARTLTMMSHKGTLGDSPVSSRSGYAIVSACRLICLVNLFKFVFKVVNLRNQNRHPSSVWFRKMGRCLHVLWIVFALCEYQENLRPA